MISSTITLFLCGIFYIYGLFSHKRRLPPYPQILSLRNHLFPERIGYSDLQGRKEVDCRGISRDRLMVALIFGQSNTGNHVETMYEPEEEVYNFFRGRCFHAVDPLLGPTGNNGSIWSRLGDRVVSQGLYERVVLAPIGVGSTTIDRWAPDGYLHTRITGTIRQLREQGLTVTHLLWDLGPSEKRTSGDDTNRLAYKRHFMAMLESIREQSVDAPIFVTTATYDGSSFNRDIQQAQKELADPARNIFPGPNTDLLHEKRFRWEVVHFSHLGIERCVDAWMKALAAAAR
jgi:hypothetical protein